LFFRYLRYNKKLFTLFFLFFSLFLGVYYLYGLPLKYFIYPFVLCLSLLIIFVILDFIFVLRKERKLYYMKKQKGMFLEDFPEDEGVLDKDYKEIIEIMAQDAREKQQIKDEKYNEMIDYYTVWAHQIKTPISAMKLNLQNEDSPVSRNLKNDLSRIESYVNMVMTYLRLDSLSSDFVIKPIDLEKTVKSAVKKFSGEFIAKKLTLNLSDTSITVLTDEKWLSFVIEQVLSNAVKYTNSGKISIYLEEKSICIEDEGIGILPEDLPRIFEKGYTGCVGRIEKNASGIGLYLCKRICDKLCHNITVSSTVGKGTKVTIDLESKNMLHE